MFFLRPAGMELVDRGDPESVDFILEDFTTDAAWHELDLSAIIPIGTKSVIVRSNFTSSNIMSWVSFRKKGNTFAVNRLNSKVQVENQENNLHGTINVSTDRKIEYNCGMSFLLLSLQIRGWYK